MAPTPERVATILLSRHALTLTSLTRLQSLWAGYGSICAISARAVPGSAPPKRFTPDSTGSYRLILKLISPPISLRDVKDEGHRRKMLSYEVEQVFYSDVTPRLGHDIPVAKLLASTREKGPGTEELEGCTAMILQDLRPEFPIAGGKREFLGEKQVDASLGWLARFHRESRAWFSPNEIDELVLPPLEEHRPVNSLWKNGGYTYLATRRTEFSSLRAEGSEWSVLCEPRGDKACIYEAAAAVLTPKGRAMESYIHGDVKSENLFSNVSGQVAFFDFQYVGLGLGVCDLAKLFTCSIPKGMIDGPAGEKLPLGQGEETLLRRYHDELTQGGDWYPWELFLRHWEAALVDWLRFQAGWGFWGNTDWLMARVRWIVESGWVAWLDEQE